MPRIKLESELSGKDYAPCTNTSYGNAPADDNQLPTNNIRDHWENPGDSPGIETSGSSPTIAPLNTFSNLQKAIERDSADALDNDKQTGIAILDEISQVLRTQIERSSDATRWLESTQTLKQHAKTPETIIGVIGSTGHGKSSLINALLDEERIVPTNCVRACTAVVTEISWNSSEDPQERYIARVEYISKEEWLYELENLCQDIVLSNGEISGDTSNKETDAGVAWAKIHAVYPDLEKDMLSETDAKSLADYPAVANFLGKTDVVRDADARNFCDRISIYIDSKKMKANSKDTNEEGDVNEDKGTMELWPLIKVVKICLKSDILSTGAIIVDLPGFGDSNAARASVANKYIQKCNGVWIVANITRAVNDKAAKQLLGQSFKRQLHLDGNYSNISFICTMTDNITMDEAAANLGLEEQFKALQCKQENLACWEDETEQHLKNDEARCTSISDYITELDRQVSRWEKLETRQRKGDDILPSMIPPRKRKVSTRSSRASKRLKKNSEESEEVSLYTSADDLWNGLEQSIPKFPENGPLTEEQIRLTIEHLRLEKNAAMDERDKLEEKMENEYGVQAKLSRDFMDARSELLELCIRKRSDLSRKIMGDDFALGVKELDHEHSQLENPELFDPEEEIRDYRQIAQLLPVFCVSSQAYQYLSGRLVKGNEPGGFPDLMSTEIPQLRSHAKILTQGSRSDSNKSFLISLKQHLDSLHIWSFINENGIELSDKEKKDRMEKIKIDLRELQKELEGALNDFIQKYKDILTEQLFGRFDVSVTKGAHEAIKIASQWPQKEIGDGGLPCISYKATVRRNGVFSGKKGPRDFNEDLASPLKGSFANEWVSVFEHKVPEALEKFKCSIEQLLETFCETRKAQMQENMTFENISRLQAHLEDQGHAIGRLVPPFSQKITALQRGASRRFTTAIQQEMFDTYQTCAQEKGRGCFKRIKALMVESLRYDGHSIFSSAVGPVKEDLLSLCNTLKKNMHISIAKMLDNIETDYANVICGRDIHEASKETRKMVSRLLEHVDSRFEPCPSGGTIS